MATKVAYWHVSFRQRGDPWGRWGKVYQPFFDSVSALVNLNKVEQSPILVEENTAQICYVEAHTQELLFFDYPLEFFLDTR